MRGWMPGFVEDQIFSFLTKVVYNRWCDESILIGSSVLKIKRYDSKIWVNNTTFFILLEITLPACVGWESPACRGHMGGGDSGFWRYHRAVLGMVMLGFLLYIWRQHWAMSALRPLSGFICILMFSSWPHHPQDVFPSPLIRLTSCSCFKDTNSVGGSSDHGLSHLPMYSLDIRVPEARGLYLSWIAGAPKFPFLFSEHCAPSKTRLKVVPSLEAWQGQTYAVCFRLVLSSRVF